MNVADQQGCGWSSGRAAVIGNTLSIGATLPSSLGVSRRTRNSMMISPRADARDEE